jgi:hypothetical protein
MLIQVIRTDNHFDFIKDSMPDSLVESKEIVKFKRGKGWVSIGADLIRGSKQDRIFNGTDRMAVNDSIFAREYLIGLIRNRSVLFPLASANSEIRSASGIRRIYSADACPAHAGSLL